MIKILNKPVVIWLAMQLQLAMDRGNVEVKIIFTQFLLESLVIELRKTSNNQLVKNRNGEANEIEMFSLGKNNDRVDGPNREDGLHLPKSAI